MSARFLEASFQLVSVSVRSFCKLVLRMKALLGYSDVSVAPCTSMKVQERGSL